MLFNLIVLVLILLITLYLATQGLMSSLIALVTATFASVLSMGLLEALQGVIAGFRPDFARGVTFLLLFFLSFSACRIVADMAVPKNIKIPLIINRATGGVVGFFCALVVMGNCVLGIEMMPLKEVLIDFDRFPNGIQGENPGTLAPQANVWLAPDRFVLAIWDGVSGRALGGSYAWGSVHPDLTIESYGYRHTVQYASRHTLYPDLFSAKIMWMTDDPKVLAQKINPASKNNAGIPFDSGQIVMVRTTVKKGSGSEHSSADADETFYRITPTEVRLLTVDKSGQNPHQYYPIGFLRMPPDPKNPKVDLNYQYQKLSLNAGQLVEDYSDVNKETEVIHDWVFQIPEEQIPTKIEVKELARADLTIPAPTEMKYADLKQNNYPQRSYERERSSLSVTVSDKNGTIIDGRVYLLRQSVIKRDLESPLNAASSKLDDIDTQIEGGTGGWDSAQKPIIQNARRNATNITNIHGEDPVYLIQAVPFLLTAELKSDPRQTFVAVPNFIKDKLEPMLNAISTGNAILTSAPLIKGKATIEGIPKGDFTVFVWEKTDKSLVVWLEDRKFEGSKGDNAQYSSEGSPALRIERP